MSKEKRKLLIYMISSFLVVSLTTAFLIFYNKVFVLTYKKNNISFKYYSNFKVHNNKKEIKITSMDDLADIRIKISERENNYINLEYDSISKITMNNMIDSSRHQNSGYNCLDHMCTGIYESNKETIKIVTEFQENTLITYKLTINKKDFSKYNDSFDIIVNSFVKKERK